MDRLISQALLQQLLDPTFSEHSYGVSSQKAYVQSGRRIVVDVDLEKFFDRVNHDILIDRLKKRIDDAEVIRLIRAYLNSGIMSDGVVAERYQGTPQGRPLSLLLANVLPDEVDKVLEKQGHCFVRYADDCNVYVRLRRCYAKLRLKVNETKSTVASVIRRKFLGYIFWFSKEGVKRKVAEKPMATFKQRIRQLTRRSGGRSMAEVIGRLKPYLLGWKAYFGLAQTPKIWRTLNEWLRHRLRAIQLKHWKRGSTIYREFINLSAAEQLAQRVAQNARCWWPKQQWRYQTGTDHRLFRQAWPVPSLMTSTSRTARRGPACRVVWEGFDEVY
ncbi:reverse transcriptase domain-containing protein [Nitrosomonas communis]|uniref:reverse transcriptase domain-containing protein n=1 Tax=Nitrosomonas communis TaxID=44574 RepID=UPI0034E937E0